MVTVIVDQLFDVAHDLEISSLGNGGHLICCYALRFEYSRRLRVQNEWHS